MTSKQISQAIAKRPFVPFVIHTKVGQEFHLFHPEAIWQAPEPDEDTIIIHDKKLGVVFTDVSCIADVVFAGKRAVTES
jgi:hypothetical protein